MTTRSSVTMAITQMMPDHGVGRLSKNRLTAANPIGRLPEFFVHIAPLFYHRVTEASS
jgi:hypothetical protein